MHARIQGESRKRAAQRRECHKSLNWVTGVVAKGHRPESGKTVNYGFLVLLRFGDYSCILAGPTTFFVLASCTSRTRTRLLPQEWAIVTSFFVYRSASLVVQPKLQEHNGSITSYKNKIHIQPEAAIIYWYNSKYPLMSSTSYGTSHLSPASHYSHRMSSVSTMRQPFWLGAYRVGA